MKTIKDIAKLAKVSLGTVDRVIHKRGGVAKKTEIKIQKIIDEFGYTPNLIAQNLVLKKSFKIAILIPQSDKDSPFWKIPNSGMTKALKEVKNFGLSADFYYYNQFEPVSYENSLDKIIESNYDGIVLVPHFTKETLLRKRKLDSLKIPYIFVNADLEGFNNISFIGQDSYKSGFLTGRLFNLTMPKDSAILVVNHIEDLENYHTLDSRIKGLRDYFDLNESSLELDELKIEKFSKDNLKRLLTKKLISNNKIRGVFLPSSKISSVASYLEEFDIDMETVIGYDITEDNIKYVNKNLITFLIGQEPFNQGYESVKIIFNLLIHDIHPKKSHFSPIQILTKENLDSYL